jgi:hypothetical protein
MGRGFKPLVPPGKAPSKAARPVTSLKLARKLTSRFHGLLNEQSKLETDSSLPPEAKRAKLKEIESSIAEMGGREAYQEASALATKNFRSSRYVFKSIVRFGLQPRKGEAPLRVLEVGAVNAQLAVSPWMRVRAIDLLSRHPRVEQKDFFAVPIGSGPPGESSSGAGAGAGSGSGSGSGSSRDAITAPTTSRLHEVDWDAWAELDSRKAAASGSAAHAGRKRQRSASGGGAEDEEDEDDSSEEEDDGDERMGGPKGAGAGAGAGAAAGKPPSGPQPSSRVHRDASAVRIVRACPSKGYSRPVTGGYDVLVNAMVINCVMDPVQRAEMLVRCR